MSNEKLKEKDKSSERLTIEELKSINGFKDINEEEATEISDIINEIAEILYSHEF